MFTKTLQSLRTEPQKGSGWIYMSCCAKPALGSLPACAVLGAEAADGARRAQSTLARRAAGCLPPLAGGTLSVVFRWAWRCSGSCSAFHLKQSEFTGGLYLHNHPGGFLSSAYTD